MENDPSGLASGLGLGLPCWRSQVRNPLPTKARGLPSGSSSSHRACLVRVTSPMWFASYYIGAGVLPCVHPKGSGFGFPLS
uniref:Putative ovule protein n=1 Tax=Solanum chacoense TaxID=4108 RepID=A0A0V0GPB2_SOLCH